MFRNRTVDEIKWKNIVEPNREQMTICRMRNECWIPKATNTSSVQVIHAAFQRNNECTNAPRSGLHYTSIACLVNMFLRWVYFQGKSHVINCPFHDDTFVSTALPTTPRSRKEPCYPLNRKLAGLQTPYGRNEKDKNLFSLRGFKPRTVQKLCRLRSQIKSYFFH